MKRGANSTASALPRKAGEDQGGGATRSSSKLDNWSTRRLNAERLLPRHFLLLLRMHRDKQVMATLGGVRSRAETRDYLKKNLDHWRTYGHGIWIFSRRGDRHAVGRGGIRFLEIDEEATTAAISYALDADHWGHGLGTEIARGLVRIAFRELELPQVIGVAYPHNTASRRVLENAGLRYEREVIHAGEVHVLYRAVR
jgi:ribosomal-protein-alanine N-acetyltransferase